MGNYKNADFYGVTVCQYTQKGSIDYKQVLAKRGLLLTEQELDTCRRKSNEVQKVSLTRVSFLRILFLKRMRKFAKPFARSRQIATICAGRF